MRRILILFFAIAVSLQPAFSQKKDTYKVRTVVIDPGHGGAKPGAQGSRSQEKDITLAVAKKFGQLITDNYTDVKVIYTRTTDVDISLAERAHIANRNKADLFISIHANSHPTSSPTGVETFVMGLSESKANLEVARKENADILLEADYQNNSDYQGFDPNAPETYVMLAMFQNAFIDKSLNFAQSIQTQYKQNLKTINRGVKQAELYVLYKTSMPSVLTEIGFISNPTEEAFMLTDEGQAKIAICLFNAFMNFKATEEGSNKPSKPVIRIKGAPKNTTPEETATSDLPTVVESVAEPLKDNIVKPVEEKPVERRVEAPGVDKGASLSGVVSPASLSSEPAKPVPAAEMPQRVTQMPPAPVPDVHPAQPAPNTPVSPQSLSGENPASLSSDALEHPVNTASSNKNFYTVQFLLHDRQLKPGAPQLKGIEHFDIIRKKMGLAYVTGHFATFQEATEYCEIIKAKTPFKDAWVFLCRLAEDESPVASYHPVAQPPVQAPLPSQPSQPAPVQPRLEAPDAPVVVVYTDTAEFDDRIVYRIQFLTSPRQMQKGDPELSGISDFIVETSPDGYVYLAGFFYTRREAEQRCAGIKIRTPFKEAFVVAYRNGVRVPLD